MDVVYVVKKTDDDNSDLRWSLRSLKNIKHDNVFIVWYKPQWCKNVKYIQAYDNLENKYKNVINKYKIILANEEISEDFILMHDDNYILEPIDRIPYYVAWTLEEHCDHIRNRLWVNGYCDAIQGVLDMFPDGYSYDVHCPIELNKKKFKYIIDTYWHLKASKKSLYCNYYKMPRKKLTKTPNYNKNKKLDDCKMYEWAEIEVKKWQPFLSSDDKVSKTKKFDKIMKDKFPNKSKYEIAEKEEKTVKLLFKKALYPYRKGQVVVMDKQEVNKFILSYSEIIW